MKKPKQFIGVMWVPLFFSFCLFSFSLLSKSVHLSISTIVASFGALGYVTFFKCTLSPIINNLPGSGVLVSIVLWGKKKKRGRKRLTLFCCRIEYCFVLYLSNHVSSCVSNF